MAAARLKDEGNKLFREKNWDGASTKYTEAIEKIPGTPADAKMKELKASLLSNRAACRLRVQPVNTLAVISDCSAALGIDKRYKKALLRRAKAYHIRGEDLDDPEAAARAFSSALQDINSCLKMDPQSAAARKELAKVKHSLERLQASQDNYQFYLKRVVGLLDLSDMSGKSSRVDYQRDIRLVMNAAIKSQSAKNAILESRFPEALLTLSLGLIKGSQPALQLEASRALSPLLSGISYPTLYNSLNASPEALVTSLLARLQAARKPGKNGPFPEQNSPFSAQNGPISAALLRVMEVVLEGPAAEKERERVVKAMVGMSEVDEKRGAREETLMVAIYLKALPLIATLDEKTLATFRRLVFEKILFSDSIMRRAALRPALLNIFLVATGKPPGGGLDAKRTKTSATKAQNRIPKEYWQGSDVKSMSFAKEWGDEIADYFDDGGRAARRACRALTLLLQANPPLGVFLITNGGKEETKDPKNAPPPPVLTALVGGAAHGDTEQRRAALGVLALASQDKIIRGAVEKGGVLPLFLELLDGPLETNGIVDMVVRCHAIVALAKQVAISEPARVQALGEKTRITPNGPSSLVQAAREAMDVACRPTKKREAEEKAKEGGKKQLETSVELSDMEEERRRMMENLAIEGVVFLSIVGKAKEQLLFSEAKKNDGKRLIENLHYLVSSKSNRAARFGAVQVLANLTRSSEDRQRDYNKELEKLRQVASKGLGPNTSAKLAKVAGSTELAKRCTRAIVQAGGVRALVRCFAAAKNEKKIIKSGSEDSETNTEGVSSQLVEGISFCLKKMATDERNRGAMVQQKGMRLLGDLYNLGAAIMDKNGGVDSKKGMWREDCAVALARIAITTNPALYPEGSMYTLIQPLIWLFSNASHELFQFEAGLGMTNIASIDASTRDTLVVHGVWSACTNLLASENEEVQRVGIECMSNLVVCEKSFERLQKTDQDIKLFLLFAKADNLKIQSAATGGLAMMTQDPDIGKNVLKLGGRKVLEEIQKSTKDPGVQMRVKVTLENLAEMPDPPLSADAVQPTASDSKTELDDEILEIN